MKDTTHENLRKDEWWGAKMCLNPCKVEEAENMWMSDGLIESLEASLLVEESGPSSSWLQYSSQWVGVSSQRRIAIAVDGIQG